MRVFEIKGAAAAEKTATGNSGAFTCDAKRLAVDIDITAVSGGGDKAVFSIERLGLDGKWYQIYASAEVTAISKVSASIGPGCGTTHVPTGQIRLVWTLTDVGGGGVAFTFSYSIVGID